MTRPWDTRVDGPLPIAFERRGYKVTAHLRLMDSRGDWYATLDGRGRLLRHVLVSPSPAERAKDAEVNARGASEQRAADVAQAVDLDARIAAATRLAADIPEAAAEAQRLQNELDQIKARLAATRATPTERS